MTRRPNMLSARCSEPASRAPAAPISRASAVSRQNQSRSSSEVARPGRPWAASMYQVRRSSQPRRTHSGSGRFVATDGSLAPPATSLSPRTICSWLRPLAIGADRPRCATYTSCQGARRRSSARTSATSPASPSATPPNETGQDQLPPSSWPSSSPAGASSGKSSRMTGPSRRSSRPSAARSTRRWKSGSWGAPNGRPSSNGTHRNRGSSIRSVLTRTRLMPVVAMPSSSR